MVQTNKGHPRRSDEEWMDIIQSCRTSGMSDKAWCEENHITPSKFYYHIRRLRNKACRIPPASTAVRCQPKQEVVQISLDAPDR